MGKRTEDMTPEQIERRAASKRAYYLRNKAEITAKRKEYYKAHKDEIDARMRTYRVNNVARKMYNDAKRRAEKLDLPFDLTIEYIDSIIPERCPVFGMELEVGVGHAQPHSPSLDRIRPEYGYLQGNVQVISNKANMMKNDASANDLIDFAAWVFDTIGYNARITADWFRPVNR